MYFKILSYVGWEIVLYRCKNINLACHCNCTLSRTLSSASFSKHGKRHGVGSKSEIEEIEWNFSGAYPSPAFYQQEIKNLTLRVVLTFLVLLTFSSSCRNSCFKICFCLCFFFGIARFFRSSELWQESLGRDLASFPRALILFLKIMKVRKFLASFRIRPRTGFLSHSPSSS